MKVFVFLMIIGTGLCLSVPSRSRSGASDPCSTSPCGKDAICESSPNGLAFCRCKTGFTGDAFVNCEAMMPGNSINTSGPQTTMPSHDHTTTMNLDHTTNQRQYPPRFTLDYNPSTDTTVQDMSRIPILGSTATVPQTTQGSFHQNRVNSPTTFPETVVHTHVLRHPPSEHQNVQHRPHQSYSPTHPVGVDPGLFPSSNSVVMDPMGQYSNCRSIRGVIVCADNSVDDLSNASPSLRPQFPADAGSTIHSHLSTNTMHKNRLINPESPVTDPHNLNQYPHNIPVHPISSSSLNSNNDCKSLCGINSVCRMVNSRPVCGCPVDYTGDPGVRCDIIAEPMEKTPECQKQTECSQTQICFESKCIDPCGLGGMCGRNANCVVIQHTQLCRCNNGFNGNPYKECLA